MSKAKTRVGDERITGVQKLLVGPKPPIEAVGADEENLLSSGAGRAPAPSYLLNAIRFGEERVRQ